MKKYNKVSKNVQQTGCAPTPEVWRTPMLLLTPLLQKKWSLQK
jgi:hypothetical protein